MSMLTFLEFYDILNENRIGFLKSQNSTIDTSHDRLAKHTNASDIIDHFANNADPTEKKSHTQWILNQYKRRLIRQEDAPRIKEALSNFEKHKSKLSNKDVNQYKSVSDVEDAVKPHLGKPEELSNRQQKIQTKAEGADLVHSADMPSGKVTVHHIKTEAAACHYGKGTKWCTAGDKDNMFNEYNKDGPLFVIHHHQKDGTIRKYQFHNESRQLMDEKDKEVNPDNLHPDIAKSLKQSNHPEIRKVLYWHNMISKEEMDNLVKSKNISNDEKKHIALSGNHEHRSELLKNHELDHDTKSVIALVGNDEHRSELLKNHELDHHTKWSIANRGNDEHRSELLKNHELDHGTKRAIAHEGNNEHRSELLRNHELGPATKWSIANLGNHEHRSELLRNHELDHDIKATIAQKGTDEHRNELLRNHELNHGVKQEIAFYGNNEHRSELLRNHELDIHTKRVLAQKGTDEHRRILANKYNFKL